MSKYSVLDFSKIRRTKSVFHQPVISRETNPDNINFLIDEDRYWIDGVGVGEWEGHDFEIANYINEKWSFEEVKIGSFAFVEDEGSYYYFDGSKIDKYRTDAEPHAPSHEPGGSDEISKFDAGIF